MHCFSSLLVRPEDVIYTSLVSNSANLLGTDTTAHTLTTGSWYLLNNVDMLEILRKELADAIPDMSSGITVSWVTLEKLPYLVSFLH